MLRSSGRQTVDSAITAAPVKKGCARQCIRTRWLLPVFRRGKHCVELERCASAGGSVPWTRSSGRKGPFAWREYAVSCYVCPVRRFGRVRLMSSPIALVPLPSAHPFGLSSSPSHLSFSSLLASPSHLPRLPPTSTLREARRHPQLERRIKVRAHAPKPHGGNSRTRQRSRPSRHKHDLPARSQSEHEPLTPDQN